MPVECLIALGANLGDRAHALAGAIELIGADEQTTVLEVSRWHETPAVGGPAGQDAFLNGAARFVTDRSPHELLELLRRVESALGRRRDVRWGPRTVDLDLIFYGDKVCDTAELTLPHPRMSFRRFVLAPAAEAAGAWIHPLLQLSISELLANLDRPTNLVAIVGSTAEARSNLACDLVSVPDRFFVPHELAFTDHATMAHLLGRGVIVFIDGWRAQDAGERAKLFVWCDVAESDDPHRWSDFARQAAVLRLTGDMSTWRDEIVAAVLAMQ